METVKITASLEDYLEAIYEIIEEKTDNIDGVKSPKGEERLRDD